MAEVASAFVSLLPSARGFGSQLSSQINGDLSAAGKAGGEKYGSGMKSRLGGMAKGIFGPLMAAAGGLAIGSFFNSAANAASDFNETVNKTDVIFGKNAGTIKNWSKTAATSLGLSQEQALSSASGFGDMFTQIGFTGAAATKMSTSVVQAAADLGSFSNLDTADVTERMSAAFRGEYDSLQAVIPNINAARVEQEAMAATGKKTAAALTAQDKAAAVLAIVHKDGARAMGDFERTSDGVANQSKIVAARAADMKRQFGGVILPVKALAIEGFGAVLTAIPKIGAAFASVGGFIKNNSTAFTVAAGVVTTIFLPALIALGVQSTISAAKVVAGWIASGASAVAGAATQSLAVVKTVAGWVLMGVQSTLQAARVAAAWVVAMGPVGWAIAAVVGLVAAVVLNWSKIKSATIAVWKAVSSAVSTAVSAVVNFVKSHWPLLLAIITGPMGLIVLAIVKNWNTIKSATSSAWHAVTSTVSKGISTVVGFVKSIPGRIVSALGNLKDLLVNAGEAVISGLASGIWSATVGRLGDTLSNVTNFIKDHKGPIEKDRVLLEPAGRAIMEGLNIGLEKGIPGLKSMLEKVTQVFKDKKSDLSSLMDEFASISSSVADRFKTDLFGGSVSDLLLGGLDSLANLQNVTDAFKTLRRKGAGSGFLHALFESGNSSLITALAGSSKQIISSAEDTFKLQTRFANQLGDMTAQNTLGPDIRGVRQEIRELRKDVRLIGSDLAHALNHTSANAQRKKAHK